jgi:hypothetical protein
MSAITLEKVTIYLARLHVNVRSNAELLCLAVAAWERRRPMPFTLLAAGLKLKAFKYSPTVGRPF